MIIYAASIGILVFGSMMVRDQSPLRGQHRTSYSNRLKRLRRIEIDLETEEEG